MRPQGIDQWAWEAAIAVEASAPNFYLSSEATEAIASALMEAYRRGHKESRERIVEDTWDTLVHAISSPDQSQDGR